MKPNKNATLGLLDKDSQISLRHISRKKTLRTLNKDYQKTTSNSYKKAAPTLFAKDTSELTTKHHHSTSASSFEPPRRPGRIAAGTGSGSEAYLPQEQDEIAAGGGPPVPPSGNSGTVAHSPQEPEQAGNGDPSPPSNPSSRPPSPPPGGGGGGGDLPGQRPRVPVMIPVFQRVPYRQGGRLGEWEGLVWALVLLLVVATSLMYMALRAERNRWLAANEGTRQMLFSMQRQGPLGGGLLAWIFDNAFLNIETNSYG